MHTKILCSILAGGILLAAACRRTMDTGGPAPAQTLNLPAEPFHYYDSSTNQNHLATLGRVLFYDKHLSINNTVACAGCHHQETGFSDNVALSRGFENRLTARNSLPIQNLGIFGMGGFGSNSSFFWDGREQSLQALILRPVAHRVEMGMANLEELPGKLQALPYYPDLFQNAFGDPAVTNERISISVAQFLNAIRSTSTRFDLVRRNPGTASLTALELQGEVLFNNTYNCTSCHSVELGGYSSAAVMDIGLQSRNGDEGVYAVTGRSEDRGRFRIPNLRNVAVTAPYMHDGRFATLDEVLEHYSHGIVASENLDVRLRDAAGAPLRLNITGQDKKAIIAFLNTLTDYDMLTAPALADPFVTQ